MRNEASREIFNYWSAIKGDRRTPLRTDVEPAALRHLLPYLFILTDTAAGVPEFRLAGTRVCELFGRELRGSSYRDLWDDETGPQAAEIARNVMRQERPALLDAAAWSDEPPLPVELLLLPIRSCETMVDRALGAFLPRQPIASAVARPLSGLFLRRWTFLQQDGEKAIPQPETAGPANSLLQRLSMRLQEGDGRL